MSNQPVIKHHAFLDGRIILISEERNVVHIPDGEQETIIIKVDTNVTNIFLNGKVDYVMIYSNFLNGESQIQLNTPHEIKCLLTTVDMKVQNVKNIVRFNMQRQILNTNGNCLVHNGNVYMKDEMKVLRINFNFTAYPDYIKVVDTSKDTFELIHLLSEKAR